MHTYFFKYALRFFSKIFIVTQRWNDPKSQLQQCCLTLRQMDGSEPDIPEYKTIAVEGPTNTRVYKVAVYFKLVFHSFLCTFTMCYIEFMSYAYSCKDEEHCWSATQEIPKQISWLFQFCSFWFICLENFAEICIDKFCKNTANYIILERRDWPSVWDTHCSMRRCTLLETRCVSMPISFRIWNRRNPRKLLQVMAAASKRYTAFLILPCDSLIKAFFNFFLICIIGSAAKCPLMITHHCIHKNACSSQTEMVCSKSCHFLKVVCSNMSYNWKESV